MTSSLTFSITSSFFAERAWKGGKAICLQTMKYPQSTSLRRHIREDVTYALTVALSLYLTQSNHNKISECSIASKIDREGRKRTPQRYQTIPDNRSRECVNIPGLLLAWPTTYLVSELVDAVSVDVWLFIGHG